MARKANKPATDWKIEGKLVRPMSKEPVREQMSVELKPRLRRAGESSKEVPASKPEHVAKPEMPPAAEDLCYAVAVEPSAEIAATAYIHGAWIWRRARADQDTFDDFFMFLGRDRWSRGSSAARSWTPARGRRTPAGKR
ncbi:MAG: hypothetical protein SFZ23_01870 [Planctomycetota bacterium]|nr:hypothetical protein [Planctomycetota bacterium]